MCGSPLTFASEWLHLLDEVCCEHHLCYSGCSEGINLVLSLMRTDTRMDVFTILWLNSYHQCYPHIHLVRLNDHLTSFILPLPPSLPTTTTDCSGFGVAPEASIPLYPIGQQRCFWTTAMGLFELHNAKNYRSGSGVAPRHTHGPVAYWPAKVFSDT